MSSQEILTPESQTPPPPRLSMLAWILVAVVVCAAAGGIAYIVVTGIAARVHAATALNRQTQEMAVPTVSVVHPRRGAADRGSGPSRQRPGVRGDAHLCPHQRLSEELVLRYRRARQGGRTAGRHRHSRSGPPTGPGARRPGHRAGQLRSLEDHGGAVSVFVQERFGGQAGRGRPRGRSAGQKGHGGLGHLQRAAPGRNAAFPERYTLRSMASSRRATSISAR